MIASRDIVGDYHACSRCGFAWHDRDWPRGCPDCKALVHWIASFWTEEDARLHVPFYAAARAAA